MRLIILHIILLLTLFSKQAIPQYNLVPNYSFEEMDSCPDNVAQLSSHAKEWFSPGKYLPPNFGGCSSEYYNSCTSKDEIKVPKNWLGYRYAKTGIAYSGFGLSDGFYREYIEIKLKETLKSGLKYSFELSYSISEVYFDSASYNRINIAALFTDTIVKRYPTFPVFIINAKPQVKIPFQTYIDTSNWLTVKGEFISSGNEKYLTIGYFDFDTLTSGIYVFVDDVKLYECEPEVPEMIVPNIFTPNGDGINDQFLYKNQEYWHFETQVFNRWGGLVFSTSESINWDGRYQGEIVSDGVYFYSIKATAIKTGEIKIHKGTITVLTN